MNSSGVEVARTQFGVCTVCELAVSDIFSISGRTLGVKLEQPTLGDHQIRQSEQRMQLRRVLGQSAIARLLVSKDVLDDVKRMLNLRSNTGLELLELLAQPSCFRIGQRTALAGAQSNVPRHRAFLIFLAPLNTLVASITEGRGLVAMQQRVGLGDVAHIGGSGDQRMGQSRISINTDVRLHTKMPLISLLGLVHLRVARPIFVFRRAGGFDDRRIYDRTFFEQQSFGRQNGVDGGEDSLGEIVFFQQATELEQGRRIGCCLPVQIDPNESADRLAVVDRIFNAFVGQPKALLGDVHAQHPMHTDRGPTAALALGIERFNLGYQCQPRRHRLNLTQKPVASRDPLLGRIFKIRKTRLHRPGPLKSEYLYFPRTPTEIRYLPANKSAFFNPI